ncbi:hypothetical protein BDN70DRAFT_929497 [Pholiota conissans]|uniref:Uncharacterized protein n=1 Tax=Pholiota conissans TaxID=109636 RepID=A0A9P5Z831_9AGAR|nr:hypothetical protein BDN70DRAFT_929497 [Pholiota conissans]
MNIDQCIEVLRRTPRLTNLTPPRWVDDTFDVALEPILNCNLTTLTVFGYFGPALLTHLICPSLETLTMSMPFAYHSMKYMFEFVQKSGCRLTSLDMDDVRLGDDDLDLLCQNIPTLRHLQFARTVQEYQGWYNLLSLLSEVSDEGVEIESLYLPELQSLDHILLNFDWIPPIFMSPISGSLHRHRSKLEFVEITLGSKFPSTQKDIPDADVIGDETHEALMTLKGQGVKIKIQVDEDFL